jgi:hypothetical protein
MNVHERPQLACLAMSLRNPINAMDARCADLELDETGLP